MEKAARDEMAELAVQIAEARGEMKLLASKLDQIAAQLQEGQRASAAAHSALKESVTDLTARLNPIEQRIRDNAMLYRVGRKTAMVVVALGLALMALAKGDLAGSVAQFRHIFGG